MEIRETLQPTDRAAWRAWLERHHATANEIWLRMAGPEGVPTVAYLDALEEALCFGWIDSIQKLTPEGARVQRFTPRRPRSQWSELNKERARRLIRLGLMTAAGRATLPDLEAPFSVAQDILAALQAEPATWAHWLAFPELYRRMRAAYVEGGRDRRAEFTRRLSNLVAQTARNRMFGNWNDGGRLG